MQMKISACNVTVAKEKSLPGWPARPSTRLCSFQEQLLLSLAWRAYSNAVKFIGKIHFVQVSCECAYIRLSARFAK